MVLSRGSKVAEEVQLCYVRDRQYDRKVTP